MCFISNLGSASQADSTHVSHWFLVVLAGKKRRKPTSFVRTWPQIGHSCALRPSVFTRLEVSKHDDVPRMLQRCRKSYGRNLSLAGISHQLLLFWIALTC